MTSVRFDDADFTDRAVDFDRRAVELTILVTSRLAEVTGTVQWNASAAGDAFPRPTVVVFPDDPDRWHAQSVSVRAATVDVQGRFVMRGMPPGDRYLAVAVEALKPGEHLDPVLLKMLRDAATPARIDAGGTHQLSLHAIARPSP